MTTMLATVSEIISEENRLQFQDEGYFILPNVVPTQHLEYLRDECERFIDETDAEMDRLGVTKLGITHKGSRYFIAFPARKSEKIRKFVFSPLMAEVCQATLGPNANLFFDQYVVKAAEKGMKFSWHQDSGYVGYDHKPYLTCWITLDDVTEENGTVYILPYSRQGTRDLVPHTLDPETGDLTGYFGDDPGIPVIVPAGSIAVFSSTVFHRSGFNSTNKMRRVYLAQYSADVIMTEDGSKPLHHSEPLLRDGENIYVEHGDIIPE